MAKNGIIHRAVAKARRYVGRIVYVIRDMRGNLHIVLTIRTRGLVLARCFWCPDGFLAIVRH